MSQIKAFFSFRKDDAKALGLAFIVLAVAFGIFESLSNDQAKRWDIAWGYWSILGTFLALLAGILVTGREALQKFLDNIPPRFSLLALVGLVLFSAWFTTTNVARQHRVLSDETSWESMALQMRYHQSGGVCNQGVWQEDVLQCHDEVNNFKAKSLSLIYSILYLVAEPTRDTALRVNLPLALASLVLLFFAFHRFTNDPWTSLALSALLATMPIWVMQSMSASTEVLYVFLLSALLFYMSLVPAQDVGWRHMLVIIPLLGLFAQTRQETIFSFLPFAIMLHPFFRKQRWHLAAFTIAVLFVSWPAINTMAAYRGYDFQGGSHSPHSFTNFFYNVNSNIRIMLNRGTDAQGLLVYPFFTTLTVLWLSTTAWIFGRMAFTRKFDWPVFLCTAFHLQSFVILYNVSGTFEIDINQRYVLIALPGFALTTAFGLKDFLQTLRVPKASVWVASIFLALLVVLSFKHIPSYQANILYKRNMLLAEENYLNTELAKMPDSSIFIYARPWQMLASGFNGFSERSLLDWSDEQWNKWNEFSGGNIYLVRGQDGYGTVNRDSRVVGFKTTDQVELILARFRTRRVLFNSQDFGYPLIVDHLLRRKGHNPWTNGLTLQGGETPIVQGQKSDLVVHRAFTDTLQYEWSLGDLRGTRRLNTEWDTLPVPLEQLPAGLHPLMISMPTPDGDTIQLQRLLHIQGPSAVLLQDLPFAYQEQAWSSPRAGASVEGNPIRIAGRHFAYGIGSHANSTFRFALGGRFTSLQTWVGLDDESACGDGVVFHILGDGKPLWVSRRLTSQMLDSAKVSLKGVQTLELRAMEQESNFCDHATWAGAWLTAGE